MRLSRLVDAELCGLAAAFQEAFDDGAQSSFFEHDDRQRPRSMTRENMAAKWGFCLFALFSPCAAQKRGLPGGYRPQGLDTGTSDGKIAG
jgi:hypothetical protein